MFRSLSLLLALPAILACLGSPASQAGEKELPPITVNARSAFESVREDSNAPQRVQITNNTDRDQIAAIDFLSGWKGNSRQRFSIAVPAESTLTTVVYPDSGTSEFYRLEHSAATVRRTSAAIVHNKDLHVVLQKGLGNQWSFLEDDMFDGGVSKCDLAEWPADARMYLSQTCLIIPEKTFLNRFDEAHRRAIRQWVLAGGELLLISDRGDSAASTEERLGAGRIRRLPDISFEGLGEKEIERRQVEFVQKYLNGNGIAEAPVLPGQAISTPSAALGIILLLFAALTGPVCLYWWAPAGKRHRLFVLIPAISTAFSLLLLVFILAGDGLGGQGNRSVHVFVNSGDHSAMIVQNQVCRTSVIINNTFRLPENATISANRSSNITRAGTWRDADRCGGSWFTSRAIQQHSILLPVSTRASVSLTGTTPEGAPVFLSTFPGTLTHFAYKDAGGRLWHIDALPPATKATALAGPPPSPQEDPATLPPKHFRASMEAVEGGELGPLPTLPSIRWERTDISVFGPIAPLTPTHAQ